jgi:hypothetical protein
VFAWIPGGHRRHVVIATLSLAATALLVSLTSAWMTNLETLRLREAHAIDRIRHLSWTYQHRDRLIQQLSDELRTGSTWQGFLASAVTDSGAKALQDLVKRIAAENDALISSAQPVPLREEKRYIAIGGRYQMSVVPKNLIPLIHAFEVSEPFLVIDTAEILNSSSTTGIAPSTAGGERLVLRLELHGFLPARQDD